MSLGSAQRLLEQGRFDEARRVLARVSQNDGARGAIVNARIFEAEGQLDDAWKVIDDAADKFPAHVPVNLFAGILAFDQGNLFRAQTQFSRVLDLQSTNELANNYLALTLMASGKREEGLARLSRGTVSDNRMFMVRLTEWMETRWLEANEFFYESRIDLSAHSAFAARYTRRSSRLRVATRLFYKKDFGPMIAVLDPLVRSSRPDSTEVYACAIGAEMLFDYDSALEYVALIPDEDLPDAARGVKARCLLRKHRFHEAAEQIRKILIIGPEDFGINYALALLCLSHGERTRARTLFLRAYTEYIVDSLEYQFLQLQRALPRGAAKAIPAIDEHL